MIEVSVIICTHNPRPRYLKRVLAALRDQTLPVDKWELLLVDNASQQPLAPDWDLSWHTNARHIQEPELGLASARQRGMREASGDLLIFVDDDNVLDPNYVSEAARIEREWPQLGAWGSGAIVPEFEVQPSQYVLKAIRYLALREVQQPRWSNFPSEAMPLGAGLCVRRSVADSYCKHAVAAGIAISGRSGSKLLGGDDFELSYVACDLGLGIGIFPELRLTHLIPQGRVAKDYLLKIVEGSYFSTVLLDYKWKGIVPRSPLSIRGGLSVVKNISILRGIDREMYLARMCATIQARRMIAASGRHASAP